MVFEKVKALIAEQLDVDASTITMETDFMKDLEADSLDAVEIILGVEDEYGIEIPDEVAENFTKVGDIVKGKVSKITAFGAFVELSNKIDGLIHISQISRDRVEKVKDVLKIGDEVEARVIKVDHDERRIGLSIKAVTEQFNEEDLKAAGEEYAAAAALKPEDNMVNLGDLFEAQSK